MGKKNEKQKKQTGFSKAHFLGNQTELIRRTCTQAFGPREVDVLGARLDVETISDLVIKPGVELGPERVDGVLATQ